MDGTRRVIRSIMEADIAGNEQESDTDKASDRWTEQYVRAAARAANDLPDEVKQQAFLLGLAIACDESGALRKLPLLGNFVQQIETKDEHKRRAQSLKKPTIYGRTDLAQHFFVSCFLAVRAGPAAAHAAGLAKEIRDSHGGSGFSFIDLAADRAGVAFAERVLANKLKLEDLAGSFRLAHVMPSVSELEEGITSAEFQRRFGSITDQRFLSIQEEIDQRLKRLLDGGGVQEKTSRP